MGWKLEVGRVGSGSEESAGSDRTSCFEATTLRLYCSDSGSGNGYRQAAATAAGIHLSSLSRSVICDVRVFAFDSLACVRTITANWRLASTAAAAATTVAAASADIESPAALSRFVALAALHCLLLLQPRPGMPGMPDRHVSCSRRRCALHCFLSPAETSFSSLVPCNPHSYTEKI